jgi:acyl carrier protein
MKNRIKQILKEELNRSDKAEIKRLARAEFEDMLKKSDIKSKIEKIVVDQLKKDNPTKKEVANITQKVLVQFYKTMWTRRNFWANKLDNI